MSMLRAIRHGDQAGGKTIDATPLTLVGHPFAPIGMGEQLRSHLVACRAVRLDPNVLDVFNHATRTDAAYTAMLRGNERTDLPGGIRIFHINGDEIDPVLAAPAFRQPGAQPGNKSGDKSGDKSGGKRGGKSAFRSGYNIIVPAWELPTYPSIWAAKLRRFDEVWALSRFIQQSLANSGIDSHLVGQSIEPNGGPLLPRQYFGIRESAVVLLAMLDLSSYEQRKNPAATLALFERICQARPHLDVQLVLKVKNGERGIADWSPPGWTKPDWTKRLAEDPRLLVLHQPLDAIETRSLIGACDVFVSLHRSEGFGRGLGEAMALGRLAIGTAWSGNLDFMTRRNALLVDQVPIPVARGEYPHAPGPPPGQYWAEPDLDHAMALLLPIIEDRPLLQSMARRGQADVVRSHGHRAVGLRILDRLERIAAMDFLDTHAPARKRTATPV